MKDYPWISILKSDFKQLKNDKKKLNKIKKLLKKWKKSKPPSDCDAHECNGWKIANYQRMSELEDILDDTD